MGFTTRFLRVREERGRLITATRLSISDHNEFKRGREYPLLVVSGSVSRGAWIRCASEDWQILYHEGRRSHKRIEKENYRTLLRSAWANQIDRARKRRRPRAPFIYPHRTNGEAERTVCQWKSRQREIETSWYLRHYLRYEANVGFFLSVSSELWRGRQFAKWYTERTVLLKNLKF